MTVGVATGTAVLALIGLAVGLVAAVVVVALFNRVVRPAREIDGYAREINTAIAGIGRNLDGVGALARTRDLVNGVPSLAVAYLDAVREKLR